jgi:hypothetical protein
VDYADQQWSRARGELIQMTQNREKMEKTLELDYKGIDKQFKEQLIKTKVSLTPLSLLPLVCFPFSESEKR